MNPPVPAALQWWNIRMEGERRIEAAAREIARTGETGSQTTRTPERQRAYVIARNAKGRDRE